eukprot:1273274-Pleurochrysis_carterae.AAC.1
MLLVLVGTAVSRVGPVRSSWSSKAFSSTRLTAFIQVKVAPHPLTSTACMSISGDAIAKHIGRFAT